MIFYKSLITQYLSFKQRQPRLLDSNVTLGELESMCAGDSLLATNVRRMRELIEEDVNQAWNATPGHDH